MELDVVADGLVDQIASRTVLRRCQFVQFVDLGRIRAEADSLLRVAHNTGMVTCIILYYNASRRRVASASLYPPGFYVEPLCLEGVPARPHHSPRYLPHSIANPLFSLVLPPTRPGFSGILVTA